MSGIEPTTSYFRVTPASDRNFGLVFSAVFAIIGVAPLVSGRPLRLWVLGLAVVFLVLALVAPGVLHPLNRLWSRLGQILHHVVNPVIMGFLFIFAVVPMGWALRVRGADLLRLKRDPGADCYWIKRNPPGPSPLSMTKQY
jgi:hypothetical protein